MASTTGQLRAIPHTREDADTPLQETVQSWTRLFAPHVGVKKMAATETRGVFLPWPLLAIIVTLAIVLVTGLVTLEVQVNNLSTTLLLRDADHGRQIDDLKHELVKESERRELLDLKVADLRERLAAAKISERKNN